MRIIEPHQFRKPLKKKRPLRWLITFVLIVTLICYSGVTYAKALPTVKGAPQSINVPGLAPPSIVWPKTGQAAFGAAGYGVLAQSGAQTMAPMASIAKVITALAVLQVKPLKTGETGPILTISQDDIDSYNKYVALGGSVVPVEIGETITEYQVLQAMMLPSANNMADTLARWAFGSTEAYLAKANALAASLNLTQTHIADSSGFSPLTKSTPHDLVLVGLNALQQPALAEIVNQKSAVIPVAGEIFNTNYLLGQNGINGIKTGHTDQAGGCLLFSAAQTIGSGHKLTFVGAVMGADNIVRASSDAQSMLRTAATGFREITVLSEHDVVGTYHSKWGATTTGLAGTTINIVMWASLPPKIKINLNQIETSTDKKDAIGSVTVTSGSDNKTIPVVLAGALTPPTTRWRLTHFMGN